MTIGNVGGVSPTTNAFKSRQVSDTKQDGGRKTVDDVLTSLREMMPGWTISTSTADWGEGCRNIQIDREILQEMGDDPKAMEKYSNMIRGFEDTVPALEQWEKDYPGQSIELGISMDSKGNVTALAAIKTLMGIEKSTTFGLPSDQASWAGIIREKLDALSNGQVEDAYGSKSWIA